MEQQRVYELLSIVKRQREVEMQEYIRLEGLSMPTVMLQKQEEKVETWEDIIQIIAEYTQVNDNIEIWKPIKVQAPLEYRGFQLKPEPKQEPKPDMVNSPAHYNKGGIEVLDFIKSILTPEEFRGYIKGNVIKYMSREADKGGDQDLEKSEFYLKYRRTGKKGLDK